MEKKQAEKIKAAALLLRSVHIESQEKDMYTRACNNYAEVLEQIHKDVMGVKGPRITRVFTHDVTTL